MAKYYCAVYTHPHTAAPVHEGWSSSIDDAAGQIADTLRHISLGASLLGEKPDRFFTVEISECGENE